MDLLQQKINLAMESLFTELNDDVDFNKGTKKQIKKFFMQSLDYHMASTDREINIALNISEIKNKFSGKGNAWIHVEKDSSIWNKLMTCLDIRSNLSLEDRTMFLDLKDLFETTGFAWLRFGGVNKKHSVFHVRFKGSKLENHIKLDLSYNEALECKLLNGTPHKLGFESGNFILNQKEEKEKVGVPDSFDESNIGLNIVSIKSLKDL
jgi:hypothetical protein